MGEEANTVIEVQNLSYSYKKHKALDRTSFKVQAKSIHGFVGPNGAGKTTTFYMIVGIIKQTKGKVFFDEEDITKKTIHERCRLGMG